MSTTSRDVFPCDFICVRSITSRALLTGMAQSATQFCRRSAFEQVGGYDGSAWIGEDVDFYWGLQKFGKARNRTVRFLRNTRVRPSSRRRASITGRFGRR